MSTHGAIVSGPTSPHRSHVANVRLLHGAADTVATVRGINSNGEQSVILASLNIKPGQIKIPQNIINRNSNAGAYKYYLLKAKPLFLLSKPKIYLPS